MAWGSLTSRSENNKKHDRIHLKSSAPVEDVDLEWAMGRQGRARQKIPKAARFLNPRTDVRRVRVHHRVWVAGGGSARELFLVGTHARARLPFAVRRRTSIETGVG
jgi:hypothetical protein